MQTTQDKPIVTYGIIIVNVIAFIVMMIYDHSLSYTTLVDFGAKVNFRIADYHFLNLIMPMFLHSSVNHIFFNMMALFYFAPLIEHILGKAKFLISYLIIGILATAGSFIFSTHPAVGASGVIYGFMGLHLFLYLNDKERYLHVFGNSVLKLIIFNLIISFIIPNIDIAGHIIGFVAGFAIYALIFPVKTKLAYKIISILILITISSSFFIQINKYKNTEDYFISKAYYLQEKNNYQELQKLDKEYQRFINKQ